MTNLWKKIDEKSETSEKEVKKQCKKETNW